MDMKAIFPITSSFSEILWQRSENQQNILFIGCFYAEIKQQIQCFAYVRCFSWSVFHPYVQFRTLDAYHPKKETFKRNLLSCKAVYVTLACIFKNFFQVAETALTILIAFFIAEHECESHFFQSRPAFPKLYDKILKRITNIGIFR